MVVFFTFAVVVLLLDYWAYRDASINAVRGFKILVLHGPVALLTLLLTMVLISWSARRNHLLLWQEFLLVNAGLLLAAVANFGVEVWNMRNFPCPEPCGIIHFLIDGTPRIEDN